MVLPWNSGTLPRFRQWNTGLFQNPQFLWKTLSWLLPGLLFIPNIFSDLPARGRSRRRPLSIQRSRCNLTPIHYRFYTGSISPRVRPHTDRVVRRTILRLAALSFGVALA